MSRPTELLRAEIAAHVRAMPDDGLLALVAAQIQPKRGRPPKGAPDVGRELVGLRILIEAAVGRMEAADGGRTAREQIARLEGQILNFRGDLEHARRRATEAGEAETQMVEELQGLRQRLAAETFRAEAAEEVLSKEQGRSADALKQGLVLLERAEAAERHVERAMKDGAEAVRGWTKTGKDLEAMTTERDHALSDLACSAAAFQKIHAEWMPRGAFDDALIEIGTRGDRIAELLATVAALEERFAVAARAAAERISQVVGLEIAVDDTEESIPGPASSRPDVAPVALLVSEASAHIMRPTLDIATKILGIGHGDVGRPVEAPSRKQGRSRESRAAEVVKAPRATGLPSMAPMRPMAPMASMRPMGPMSWEKPSVSKVAAPAQPVSLASQVVAPDAVKDGSSRIACLPMVANISAINCMKNQALLARAPEAEGTGTSAKLALRLQLRTVERCKGCSIGPRVTKRLHKLGVKLPVVVNQRKESVNAS